MTKKEIFDDLRNNQLEFLVDKEKTDEKISKLITEDYADLIDLRNRIKENGDIYEEDHITLDHILDYIELFMIHLEIAKWE